MKSFKKPAKMLPLLAKQQLSQVMRLFLPLLFEKIEAIGGFPE